MKKEGILFDYLIVLVTIFISGTPIASSYSTYVMTIAAIVLTLFCIYKKQPIFRTQAILFTACLLSFVMTMILNLDDSYMKVMGYICIVYIAFITSNLIGIKRYASAYVNIMSVISLISLLLYIIALLNKQFVLMLPAFKMIGTGESYRTFFGLHYYSYHEAAGLAFADFSRNMGPFREPGMYQFILIIALIYMLFVVEETTFPKSKSLIFTLAIATTISTTGIISLCLLAIAYIVSHKSLASTYSYKVRNILILALFSGVAFCILLFEQLFKKIIVRNASVLDRTISTENDINIWLERPIFGAGPKVFFNSMGSNNGLTSSMALFGIVFIVIILYLVYNCICRLSGHNTIFTVPGIVLFAVIMIQLYSQALMFIPVFLIMLFLNNYE